jgi:CRP-like cAMP-binding protein
MEKKGDILNQLAIISDLLEKINAETKSTTIVLELSNQEFLKAFDTIQKKYGMKMEKPKDSFNIRIGLVDIVFNTNNV